MKVEGGDAVTGVVIGQVGSDWKIIPGTEKHFDVDTVCLAVGLSPMSQLLKQAEVKMNDTKGGHVPEIDKYDRVCLHQRTEVSLSKRQTRE